MASGETLVVVENDRWDTREEPDNRGAAWARGRKGTNYWNKFTNFVALFASTAANLSMDTRPSGSGLR